MGQMIQGVFRHLLTAAGGALVAKGVVDAGTAEAAIGALVTLIGVGWSVWEKRQRG
jgi:hypothetical protein